MMNVEWDWNEWQYENPWKPCARAGAAMLSSVLLLMSVQEPLQMPTTVSALTKNGFGVSALQMDTGSSVILKKAQTLVLEGVTATVNLPLAEKVETNAQMEQPIVLENTENAIENVSETELVEAATIESKTVAPVSSQEIAKPEVVEISGATVVPSEEDAKENLTNVIADNGYLISDAGMIYGISGTKDLVEDGILILPSEGCTGIAAGALSTLGAEVEEIEIPANITEIEPGAFTGLSELGWIETDSAHAVYACVDGVLYAAGGTELLAFPAAWTGTFQVPEGVTRFAEYAFEGTNLTCIDARACALEETGNLDESVELLQ